MRYKEYENCRICPRECRINRYENNGFCGADAHTVINKVMLHEWEEPCICHGNGAGAVFFSGCQLKCVYCQNYEISSKICGKIYSSYEMAELFLSLQNDEKACNIDLITAAPYLPEIKEALIIAKSKGLTIPIVYNCGGYEAVSSIKELSGLIDIYLPDMKYFSPELSRKYSTCPDYFEKAIDAIGEMISQVGKPLFSGDKLIKGVMIRHLMLPRCKDDSIRIIKELKKHFGEDSFIFSLMRQYTPSYKAQNFDELKRNITSLEYQKAVEVLISENIKYAYTQEKESSDKAFIPDFNS